MPIVKTESGVKHFPYTKAGKKAAKKAKSYPKRGYVQSSDGMIKAKK